MRGSYGYTRDNDNMGQDMLNMTGQFVRQWENLDNYIDQEQVQASQNKLLQRVRERGGDLSGLSFDDVENIYDMQAVGLLQQQNSQNEQYRLQGMKNRDASDTEYYNQKIYPTMALIQQAYEKGDVQSFDVLAQQLGNLMGTPYRYKLSEDGKGFDEYFRSDNAMGFTPTGRKMTREDVYKLVRQTADGTMFYMGGVGGQRVAVNPQYNMWAERQRQATARGNIESALNPKLMVGPDGKRYYAAFQNKWADYNADSDVLLFDESGRKVGMFGASQLGRNGFRLAGGGAAGRGGGRGGRGGRRGTGGGTDAWGMPTGGRAGSSRGGAAAQPGAQGGQPQFKVSESQNKIIREYCTDPETGKVNHQDAALLLRLAGRTNGHAEEAIGLLEWAQSQFEQQGQSPEQAGINARKYAMQFLGGGGKPQNNKQSAQQPAGAPNAAAQPAPPAKGTPPVAEGVGAGLQAGGTPPPDAFDRYGNLVNGISDFFGNMSNVPEEDDPFEEYRRF